MVVTQKYCLLLLTFVAAAAELYSALCGQVSVFIDTRLFPVPFLWCPSFVSRNQLSSIFLGRPLPFFPGSRPSNTVLSRESWRNTHALTTSSVLFSMCLEVPFSYQLVLTPLHPFCVPSIISSICDAISTFHMLQAVLYHSFQVFCNVHVSLPYSMMLHTKTFTMCFFSWRLMDPHMRSFS